MRREGMNDEGAEVETYRGYRIMTNGETFGIGDTLASRGQFPYANVEGARGAIDVSLNWLAKYGPQATTEERLRAALFQIEGLLASANVHWGLSEARERVVAAREVALAALGYPRDPR